MQLSDVDYRDIQGLVRFGYGHLPEACFYLAEIASAANARAWLAVAPVTSAVPNKRLTSALHVAFTRDGLAALNVPSDVIEGFSPEFRVGMVEKNRSRRLGDIEANDPEHWLWGAPGTLQPHVLIMIYAKECGLADWEKKVKGELWDKAFHKTYALQTVRKNDLEPFGFVDGVSQPRLDWERRKPTRLRATTKYSNLSALGEFLLGYPNEYGRYTDRPLLDAGDQQAGILPLAEDVPGKRDFGRNGTYLVLRDLSQNVALFREFVDGKADHNQQKARELATALGGRVPADIPLNPPWPKGPPPWPKGPPPWNDPIAVDDPKQIIPSGGPVTPLSLDAIEGVGPDLEDVWLDQFTFKRDPDGTTCPIGAHIRRANPRNADFPEGTRGWLGRLIRTLGFARKHPHEDVLSSTRFHRILRRGRAYGAEPKEGDEKAVSEPRGLRFVCLNANIARQFEFIQTAWFVNPKFNGLDEDDPLVGNRTPLLTGQVVNAFTRAQDNGPPCRVHDLPQFVNVLGGAYFFLPGISALRYIARG